jgi:tetratricopeptide (TPR) repeat protein
MSIELILNFSDTNELTVRFNGEDSSPIAFQNPLTAPELEEVSWYLETYGAQYTADVDDDRANRLAVNLKKFGIRLFEAAFAERSGMRLFDRFLEETEPGRLVTVQSVQPEILALPWELLHQPGGAYVFNEKPRISVRRNLAGSRGGRAPKKFKPKEKLRVLMVVSRPTDAEFIDPRGEALAVLEAVKEQGRIEVEFLRPATLENLTRRLEDEGLPRVDILHFDGHGVFDPTGMLAGNSELLKGEGQNMGYLLFEKAKPEENKKTKKLEPFPTDLVSAERLGELLNQQGLGLVVLSACQSSMYGKEEKEKTEEGRNEELAAIGSVAARLTQTGVQSVVAMSYSVLVKTAEMLFGAFYGNLVRGQGIGEALDNARRSLLQNPERGERSRGQERIVMRLEDWFVPTLYQSGSDRGMVNLESPPAPNSGGAEPLNAIPEPIAGFFGRRQELWQIERAFTPNPGDRSKETRRVTIAGFGGQGKTALAAEAGRWLVRSGMFETAVFVDYAAFQGTDGVALAVSTIARDLDTNLIDADAVTVALGQKKTLLILDNLEDLQGAAQQALLGQAIAWSEAGQSRVLVTTRQNDLDCAGYEVRGYGHQLIGLQGLGQEDAINYFQGLMAVPPLPVGLPRRVNLIELFGKVDFHPLSIALVAEELRVRSIVDVERALDRLLAAVLVGQSKDRCLVASLNLSLERLDGEARSLVRRLGVFEGGAMEDALLHITEFTPEQWQPLRRQLELAGLLRSESLEYVGVGVTFLKFHPTLVRVLWASLGEGEQGELRRRHYQCYYSFSAHLCQTDYKNPYVARAIVQRELPNLLVAVRAALDAGEEWAVEFVDNVNIFLAYFGMNVDRADLIQRAMIATQSITVGSQSWYLAQSNMGDQLRQSGQPQAAQVVFEEILTGLGKTMSYEKCITLGRLGCCLKSTGQLAQAAQIYHQELNILDQLDPSDYVVREIGAAQTDLADILRDMGDYGLARQAYETALEIAKVQGDHRQQGVVNFQVGSLELLEGNLLKAEKRYQAALTLFCSLNEPAHEAICHHQLGRVYQEAKDWKQAENAYRSAARLLEAQGNLAGAAGTWSQLAVVCELSGKAEDAEAFYQKAIEDGKKSGDIANVAKYLSNFANLLQTQGVLDKSLKSLSQKNRLSEAQQLAEESISISKYLDPAAAEIWKTYGLLAQIATQQGEAAKAQDCRLQARQSYSAFAGSRQVLERFEEWIQGVVMAIGDAEVRQQLEEVLPELPAWFATTVQRILAGVRDEDQLCDELSYAEEAIVIEILNRL